MDQNEDVSKELASHTSNLSTYLEYFKKKSEVDKGDGFVTQIDNIHKYGVYSLQFAENGEMTPCPGNLNWLKRKSVSGILLVG